MKFIYAFTCLLLSSDLISQPVMQEIVIVKTQQCTKRPVRDTLNKIQAVNIEQALAGKRGCGIQVRSSAATKLGCVGTGNIRFRCGAGSEYDWMIGHDPLYVVDGTILPNINEVNNDDIEDITVLQSPEAQALFGIRGRYGAIVIATRRKKLIIKDSVVEKTTIPVQERLKVYPNPVARGGFINLPYYRNTEKMILRIINLDGNSVMTKDVDEMKGINKVQIDPRWTAGSYYVQLLYANGRLAASGKIVVQ